MLLGGSSQPSCCLELKGSCGAVPGAPLPKVMGAIGCMRIGGFDLGYSPAYWAQVLKSTLGGDAPSALQPLQTWDQRPSREPALIHSNSCFKWAFLCRQ